MSIPDEVVIIGGGVIGCGLAWELTRRGRPVTIVERGPIGNEASLASAGIISLPNRTDWRAERIELGKRSLAMYPEWVAEVEERSGISVDYHRRGEWTIAVDDAHAAVETRRAEFQRGLGYEVKEVSVSEARRREPALPPNLQAAWFTPIAGSLTVHRLTLALAAAVRSAGGTVIEQTPVAGLAIDAGRVQGVRLADRTLTAETVVLATGAWTRLLGDASGLTLPIKPVKGQLIAFRNAPVRPVTTIAGHGGYARPRPDGSVLVAATEEPDAGFDRRVTGDGLTWLLELTRTLCPELLHGEVAESWTGLRPGSETGEPIMGRVPGVDGLWVSAGHFRTGAKEAPGSSVVMAEALASNDISPLLAAFAPQPPRGSVL